MAKKKRPFYDPSRILALSSPVRHEIIDCLNSNGPMSIADMASELGRRADTLYFHFERLLKSKLIQRVGSRQLTRNTEAIYGRVARGRIVYDLTDKEAKKALCTMANSMLRVAGKDFLRAVDNRTAQPTGRLRNLWASRIVAWLSDNELKRLNELLSEIHHLLDTNRDCHRTNQVSLLWVLAPLAPITTTRRNCERDCHQGETSGNATADDVNPQDPKASLATSYEKGDRS